MVLCLIFLKLKSAGKFLIFVLCLTLTDQQYGAGDAAAACAHQAVGWTDKIRLFITCFCFFLNVMSFIGLHN